MSFESTQVVAPLSGYYSLSSLPPPYNPSTTITLVPSETSYHQITFTLTHIQSLPSTPLTDTPTFIQAGDTLGVLAETGTYEKYLHLESHKTVESEVFTINPTQFLQPLLEPQVRVEYECNDVVAFIGGTVVYRDRIAPDSPEEIELGNPLVLDTIPGHEFPQPTDQVMESQGSIISGDSATVFSTSTFLMVGPIPVEFGEHCYVHIVQF